MQLIGGELERVRPLPSSDGTGVPRGRGLLLVPRFVAASQWDTSLAQATAFCRGRRGPIVLEAYVGPGSLREARARCHRMRACGCGRQVVAVVMRPAALALALVVAAGLGALGGALWLVA